MILFCPLLLLHISLANGKQIPPNILFVMADDLGFNDISWNNPAILAPNLDRLAADGLILQQAYSAPSCSPSRSALLTGLYPAHTGMQHKKMKMSQAAGLYTGFKLLPEYLKDLGYRTEIVGK